MTLRTGVAGTIRITERLFVIAQGVSRRAKVDRFVGTKTNTEISIALAEKSFKFRHSRLGKKEILLDLPVYGRL